MLVYELINQYVEAKGIKQSFIAEKTGLPKDTISKILKGDRKLQADEFFSICEALGVDPNMFRANRKKSA